MSKSGHDERAKQDLETKWTSGGHGQSIGLPSVVKAVIHCHDETFLQKMRELEKPKMCSILNCTTLEQSRIYAAMHQTIQTKVVPKTNKMDSNFEMA